MFKKLLLFCILFEITTLQPAFATKSFHMSIVKVASLPIYEKMSKTSPIMRTLSKGDAVTITAKVIKPDGMWCIVEIAENSSNFGFVDCNGFEENQHVLYQREQNDLSFTGSMPLNEHPEDTSTEYLNNKLVYAVIRGDVQEVQNLLHAGADANAENNFNQSVLILAAKEGYPDVVKVLLEQGANVNTRDNSGSTALEIASTRANWFKKMLTSDFQDKDSFSSKESQKLFERYNTVIKLLRNTKR